MSKPTILSTPKLKADEIIVRDLKKFLAEAEAGEITSICIVAWDPKGDFVVTGVADDVTKKIGALTRMIYDLLK